MKEVINKHRLADWSQAPDWANYHAVDQDEVGYWYGNRPRLSLLTDSWLQFNNIGNNQKNKPFDLKGINWIETLETRPEQNQNN